LDASSPHVILLAGPNGAGKTTAAPKLLRKLFNVDTFVNADIIAQGLSGFSPESVAIEAGAMLITRVKQLAERRANFAFETTLASRTFAPWIRELVQTGYAFELIFLWLPSPEVAIERVKRRVQLGGHNVPEATIRTRYIRGIRNFFELYRPLAVTWTVYDGRFLGDPCVVAVGGNNVAESIFDRDAWISMIEVDRGRKSR
jgi:predicted ABC-type ATPase